MPTPRAIGAIELSSIGVGYQIEDDMLKAASVELLIARTICSGKYLIILTGSVSDVEAAVQAGLAGADEAVIDQLVIPNVHGSVFPALGQSITLAPEEAGALGVIEPRRGQGIGRALLLRCLHAMEAFGYGYAVAPWVQNAGFYERVVGAAEIEGSAPGIFRGPLQSD